MTPFQECRHTKEQFTTGRFRTASLLFASFFLLSLTVPALAGNLVPFRGSAMTTDVTGSFMFPILMVHVSGTGHATHLGQFTLDENLLFNVITHGFVGQIMWTAANGDKLLGSSVGMFDPTTGATAGKTTFSGGTGRFENATGVIQFKGVSVSISPPLLDVTYDGVISSPGANKK